MLRKKMLNRRCWHIHRYYIFICMYYVCMDNVYVRPFCPGDSCILHLILIFIYRFVCLTFEWRSLCYCLFSWDAAATATTHTHVTYEYVYVYMYLMVMHSNRCKLANAEYDTGMHCMGTYEYEYSNADSCDSLFLTLSLYIFIFEEYLLECIILFTNMMMCHQFESHSNNIFFSADIINSIWIISWMFAALQPNLCSFWWCYFSQDNPHIWVCEWQYIELFTRRPGAAKWILSVHFRWLCMNLCYIRV